MRFAVPLLIASFGLTGVAIGQSEPAAIRGSIGIATTNLPTYVGSEETRVLPLPVVSLEYRGRVFLSTTSGTAGGLGLHLIRGSALSVDVMVGGTDKRPEDRGDALAGMGDRGFGSNVAATIGLRQGMLHTSVDVRQGLNQDAGFTATVSAGVARQFGRWSASLGGSARAGNSKQVQYDFGVDSEQAAVRDELIASGDPRLDPSDAGEYAPEGGLIGIGVTGSLGYAVSRHWTLMGFASADRLEGDASRSPLVRDRQSVVTGIGVSYRW